jgi:hypothetical protein
MSGRANRTDTYPDFPYFTPEERDRIDKFLKEMERKHGPTSLPFQITPRGSTEHDRYEDWKKLADAEIAAGTRQPRRKKG